MLSVAKPQATLEIECPKCVLNSSASDLTIMANGKCNYCNSYEKLAEYYLKPGIERERELASTIETVRLRGKGKRYDCIAGVSGGVDSSYVVYLAKRYNLRPLLVHFDNGWNTELATKNIEKIVEKTGFDLYTYVVNWPEFRDLQLAYLKASVIDIEVPTDHLVFATLHQLAAQHGTRYILNGFNIQTEFIMPAGWNYQKEDAINLKAIHKRFGTKELRNFPSIGFLSRIYYRQMLEIQNVLLLGLVNFQVREAEETLAREFGWSAPPCKHGESIFTRFYQSYLLPNKFGIDKRRAHYSNLICSGQMRRDEALAKLSAPILPRHLIEEDRMFFLKKLGLCESELNDFMRQPVCSHESFPSERKYARILAAISRVATPLTKAFRVSRRIRERL